jgi:hypothetical protein
MAADFTCLTSTSVVVRSRSDAAKQCQLLLFAEFLYLYNPRCEFDFD